MSSWWLTPSQVLVLACAPLLMVVVSYFEGRWGPRVAGIVAAAPVTALIGLLLVHSDLGATASSQMGLRMSGYVPAQVAVAVVVVALVHRVGYVGALLAAVLAFAGLAALTVHLPVAVAVAASVLMLAAGPRLLGAPRAGTAPGPNAAAASATRAVAAPARASAGPAMVALRAVVSLATALALLLTAQAFGPAAGGAIGAFPVFTITLCSFLFLAAGRQGVHQVLAGMVAGLPPYFAFVLTFGLAVPHAGAAGASLAGAAVCACCYLASAALSARSRGRSRGAGSRDGLVGLDADTTSNGGGATGLGGGGGVCGGRAVSTGPAASAGAQTVPAP